MITRVRLVNWKSHLNSELEFSKGVNALFGIMGSGKTSVMQAIAFALFGTFSALGSRKLSLDDLIMSKPSSKDSASVEVEFAANGKKYSVKRVVKRDSGTTTAEIRENGKLLEVNPQGVSREVERVLQMDYDMFSRAVYSEQNALDYFLQIPKGKRMQQIDAMLKLDRYETAREKAVSIRNRLFERRKEMLRVVEDMKGRRFEEKTSDLEKTLAGKKNEAEKLNSEASAIERARKRLSEKVVTYEADDRMLNDIVRKSDSLSSRIAEMQRQLESRKLKVRGTAKTTPESLKQAKSEAYRLEARLEGFESEIRILRDGVATKNGRIHFFREQIKDAKLRLSAGKENELRLKKLEAALGENPDKKLGEMLESLDALRKKLYALAAEREAVEKGLSELKGAGDKCPVCESHLTGERKKELLEHRLKHMGEIDLRLREAKENEAKEAAQIEGFKNGIGQYSELRNELKELDPLRDKIKDSEDKIGMLMKEVGSIAADIQKRQAEEKRARQLLEKMRLKMARDESLLREKEEFEALNKERGELAKQLKSLEKHRKALAKKTKGKDIKALRAELQEAVGSSRSLEAKLDALQEMVKEKTAALRDLEVQRNTFLRYKKDVAAYEKLTVSMDVFISVLRSTQDQLRDEFLKTVNYIMNQIWEELYPYGDFSEIRMLVDKDYVLQLKAAKGWLNADAVSGGERSLASLALRIAFSLAFTPNLRWLILDEPTHNLDRNAIEHFGSVLRDKMENIIDQVFLITHEERLSDYITGSTYRLERDKEIDGVTKIAEI